MRSKVFIAEDLEDGDVQLVVCQGKFFDGWTNEFIGEEAPSNLSTVYTYLGYLD